MTLVGCPDDAGEHLLGVRAVASAIATAQTLRMTTAGRMACSARQLVASTDGCQRKANTAGNSMARWAANRSAASSGDGFAISRASRASSRPRAVAKPWSLNPPPASRRSRNSRAACRTAFTRTTHRLRGWSSCRCLVRRSRWARHVWCSASVKRRYGAHPSRTSTPEKSAPRTVAASSKPRPARIA